MSLCTLRELLTFAIPTSPPPTLDLPHTASATSPSTGLERQAFPSQLAPEIPALSRPPETAHKQNL